MRELMREVRLSPYRAGMGPSYRLRLYETGTDAIGYELAQFATEYVIQTDFGQFGFGFEDMTTEETHRTARDQLKCYRENEPHYPHRLIKRRIKTELFSGSDFRPSPLHSIDGDESVSALLGFLTLRLGDTDREYFDRYTAVQLDFARDHAESLSMETINRFGEI